MRWILTVPALMLATVVLAGCQGKPTPFRMSNPDILTPDEDTPRPKYRAGLTDEPIKTGAGFVEGQAAATLDASTEAERQEALATDAGTAEKQLGKTVASLGDVAQQGFWLKTPLVIAERQGRVVWADNGNAVKVLLIPKQGAATSGSQISLAAMRALGIPLTALTELLVFAE